MTTSSHELRESVRRAYSAAADAPDGRHPFPVGAVFARDLGYPDDLLRALPDEAVAAFAGVSSVSLQAPLRDGLDVIDLGCGAGLDSLIAAQRVRRRGRVVGIDFSEGMLDRARRSARRLGLSQVSFVRASAEQLPFPDSSVDVALVNGIFNLNPFREEIFRELGRVVRPGGHVSGAELVLSAPLPEHLRSGNDNWFS
ncbi:methyltransferase domain-containing protein [uncultured Paludibaculum sp.]|uniref:methyltransferase domain-containing protein n=1 Tax=uncultured Paludibaculum sp. TaxID=1765020 RepID=UPI002AAAB5FD|nr:methyltransferase domain-containing protein [uncultured Paludibaculum sp.]